jgi:hypothetical protein
MVKIAKKRKTVSIYIFAIFILVELILSLEFISKDLKVAETLAIVIRGLFYFLSPLIFGVVFSKSSGGNFKKLTIFLGVISYPLIGLFSILFSYVFSYLFPSLIIGISTFDFSLSSFLLFIFFIGVGIWVGSNPLKSLTPLRKIFEVRKPHIPRWLVVILLLLLFYILFQVFFLLFLFPTSSAIPKLPLALVISSIFAALAALQLLFYFKERIGL